MTGKKQKIVQAVVIALITIIAGTGLIVMSNANPMDAYTNFFRGIFGNLNGFCEVFVKATPLIFTGLGCAVAFRTVFSILEPKVSFTWERLHRPWWPLDFREFRELDGLFWPL